MYTAVLQFVRRGHTRWTFLMFAHWHLCLYLSYELRLTVGVSRLPGFREFKRLTGWEMTPLCKYIALFCSTFLYFLCECSHISPAEYLQVRSLFAGQGWDIKSNTDQGSDNASRTSRNWCNVCSKELLKNRTVGCYSERVSVMLLV